MPYPAQVTPERILEQARRVIDQEGAASLSLGRLATDLGIKAPSLYRYYASKEALIRAVNDETVRRLFDVMAGADDSALDAPARLTNISAAYRRFALDNAPAYMLAFADVPDAARGDDDARVAAALPYQSIFAAWIGDAASLAALRGLLAIMHGYVTLEINGQFRRGGDLDATYAQVVRAYFAGWTAR
jgi:AcrR family transcriptional regulator